ncbi:glycosyltransferase family 39 protein, partial [Candidatus Microgenomates bacterium]|nr:glycosyltransferase family 39 protein [Candidatus Microgenomates bacterium]
MSKFIETMKANWFLLVFFIIAAILFSPVFSTYFTGDDFFHFKLGQTDGSLISFIRLFGFYPISIKHAAFYRPIFREALYNIFYSLFGLNYLPFRILQFIIHFINIFLIYVTFKKLINKKLVALLTSFLFAVCAANVGSFYYLAGGIQAQGALMFVLLSLLSFINKRKIISFVFFLLAISTHEMSIGLPLLLAGIIYLQEKSFKDFITKSIKQLWIYGLVLIVYLYMNFFVIGFSAAESAYKLNFNFKTLLNTLMWYISWSIGLPEMLLDFLLPGFKLNPNLLGFYGNYFKFIFPAFFVTLIFIFISIVRSIKKIVVDKIFLFLIFWFIVGILPVVFLPIHKQTYYLQISLPAILGLFAYIATYRSSKFILIGFIVSFLILNIASAKLADITYWAKLRGQVANKLVTDFKNQYPTLPRGTVVFIKNDPNYPFIP